MEKILNKWNEAYRDADIANATSVTVLQENAYLLPEKGEVLDLACGRGGNALFLACLEKHDFTIDAVDISPVVIEKLTTYIGINKLPIEGYVRDIETQGLIPEKKYDIVVDSYYLHRPLFPSIISALKPGGLLFYQTWSQKRIDEKGPNNPKFRLESAELLQLSAGLIPVLYRENGILGRVSQGLRNEVQLIAQKPE